MENAFSEISVNRSSEMRLIIVALHGSGTSRDAVMCS